VILADVLVLLGYGFFFLVLRENHFASLVVPEEKGKKIVTIGLYAIVRHPMYLGLSFLFIFTPLALGSYRATILVLMNIPIFMAMIGNEEELLEKELSGYSEYIRKTRWRYIPGFW
jgi:protein-S-isoprenylcysteine O-methyltransferase Ste14